MDLENSKYFEDIMRCLGYRKADCENDISEQRDRSKYENINFDILGGFQEIEPTIMVLIAEVLGNAISGDLPPMVMNSLGNWLQLVGQVIQLYIAQ